GPAARLAEPRHPRRLGRAAAHRSGCAGGDHRPFLPAARGPRPLGRPPLPRAADGEGDLKLENACGRLVRSDVASATTLRGNGWVNGVFRRYAESGGAFWRPPPRLSRTRSPTSIPFDAKYPAFTSSAP